MRTELEDRIDFADAEKERQALIEILTNSLTGDKIEQLLSESVSFRSGRIQPSVYHNHLRDYAISCGIDISLYPNLSGYTDYVNIHDKIVLDALFVELDELIGSVQSQLIRNE